MQRKVPAAIAAAIITLSLAGAPPADAAEAAAGQAAFNRIGCWGCHGYVGQGGRDGPAIARPALPYPAFSAFVRTTTGEMPPFTARVLPEADLESIYAYLQSIPPPPDPATIPLLQQ